MWSERRPVQQLRRGVGCEERGVSLDEGLAGCDRGAGFGGCRGRPGCALRLLFEGAVLVVELLARVGGHLPHGGWELRLRVDLRGDEEP